MRSILSKQESKLIEGGDPAAPSSTATLLRLHHDCLPKLGCRSPLQVKLTTWTFVYSLDVTGGVYKTRERIHRRMADRRLLAIPASCRRVAAYNPN
jgi:hypothetical protein